MGLATFEPGTALSIVALVAAVGAAIAAFFKIGPERQVSLASSQHTLVEAQDTVIDNLRDEITRLDAKVDRERELRHEQLAEERRRCDEELKRIRDDHADEITRLRSRVAGVEERTADRRSR